MAIRSDNGYTVSTLAQSIKPEWSFPEDWFFWPPDVFALTSIIFQRTGCYSHVLGGRTRSTGPRLQDIKQDTVWSMRQRTSQWQVYVEKAATSWLEQIHRIFAESPTTSFADFGLCEVLQDHDLLEAAERVSGELGERVTLVDLRLSAGKPNDDSDARVLCDDLIFLHAVADEACSSFGLPNAPSAKRVFANYFANLLLTTWGSLSAIPKHQGMVLPKMRTPRSGLSLRSLSHHVTFHGSEVEVMWRAVPWANMQENTLNILCVPWPFKVSETCFDSESETFESVRYFDYATPKCGPSRIDQFVELVQRASETISRLHLLVFPETALTEEDYTWLMVRLDEEYRNKRLRHVPMIVAGIQHKTKEESLNQVRLATYFAGRWYDLSQLKHHRWKLDRNQIRQYGLQGRLSTAREWYETTSIAQRRLTFLAPNGWLTLCPLICEDLAQLEPVSEIVRGVGPTLLMALLLDGPQLKERWSARYASVFADDPGSAVLTLTSLGMVERSRRLEGGKPDEEPSRTVGLWKDAIRGWETLEPAKEEHALLLTISSTWTEEYTADGRTDHGFAAAFKFEGLRPFRLLKLQNAQEVQSEDQLLDKRWTDSQQDIEALRKRYGIRSWEDIRELAAATYALDAAMQLESDNVETVLALLLGKVGREFKEKVPERISELTELLTTAEKYPARTGVAAAREGRWPTKSLCLAAEEIKKQVSAANDARGTASHWERLIDVAIERLEAGAGTASQLTSSDEVWVPWALSIAILAAVDYRLEKWRTEPSPPHGGGEKEPTGDGAMSSDEAADLSRRIETALREYA